MSNFSEVYFFAKNNNINTTELSQITKKRTVKNFILSYFSFYIITTSLFYLITFENASGNI